jgi:hypothetical protein
LTHVVTREWLREHVGSTRTNPTQNRANRDIGCGHHQRNAAMARVEALCEDFESTINGLSVRNNDGARRSPREVACAVGRTSELDVTSELARRGGNRFCGVQIAIEDNHLRPCGRPFIWGNLCRTSIRRHACSPLASRFMKRPV